MAKSKTRAPMISFFIASLLLTIFIFLAVHPLQAAIPTATVIGSVSDESGAVIPGS